MYSFGDISISKASLADRQTAHTQICPLFRNQLDTFWAMNERERTDGLKVCTRTVTRALVRIPSILCKTHS